MRNLKRALSLGLTAAMISGLMVMGSSAASYADVTSENNVEAIEVLEAVGIMIGDENGNFNPDQNVTRNEMAVIMANLMEYNVASYKDTSPFTDVPSWAEPYVAACWTNGITSGYSDTIYGGSDNVTTAQAALMLMKALGYFQYASDFGSDWQLATTRQGNAIDLFVGVDSGVTAPMTRNDVAKLVLNTLESGTVEASTDGSWTIGDVTINNNVQYSYVTSNQPYATAIDDARSTSNTTDANRSIVELGEQLYMGDLSLEDGTFDDFNRPSRTWSYDGEEIGTYAKKELLRATYTTAVEGGDVYGDIGATACGYDLTYSVDGVAYSDAATDDEADKLARRNSEDMSETGRGVLTEVYVDTVAEETYFVVINTYLAEAVNNYSESNQYATLRVYDGLTDAKTVTTTNYNVDVEDVPAVANVTEGTFYQVNISKQDGTVDGDIVILNDVEVLENSEITEYSSDNGNLGNAKVTDLTVDGNAYEDNKNAYYDDEILYQYDENLLTDNTYNVYLDQYGYFLGVDLYEGTKNYVFITGFDRNSSNLSVKTATATAIFLDGTMDNIDVNVTATDDNIEDLEPNDENSGLFVEWSTQGYHDPDSIWADHGKYGENGIYNLNQWYTYTVNESGVYTLKPAERMTWTHYAAEADGDDVIIRTDNLSVKDDYDVAGRVYGNDDTVFVTVDLDKVDTTYGSQRAITEINGVYTGVQEVDLIVNTDEQEAIDEGQVYTVFDSKGYAIGAVVVGEAQGNTGNYAYVLSEAKSEGYNGDYYTWTFDAVVEGEKQTLTARSDYNKTIDNLDEGDVVELRFDENDYVVNVKDVTDMYQNFNDDIEGYDVYFMDEHDSTSTAEIVRYEGHTLYITEGRDDNGLAIARDAKAVVIQDEDSEENVVTNFSDVESAVEYLVDPDDSTEVKEYDGKIMAVLNSDGAAAWVVFDSDTPLVTGGQQSGGRDTEYYSYDYYVNGSGFGWMNFTVNRPSFIGLNTDLEYTFDVYANGHFFDRVTGDVATGNYDDVASGDTYVDDNWNTQWPSLEPGTVLTIENFRFTNLDDQYYFVEYVDRSGNVLSNSTWDADENVANSDFSTITNAVRAAGTVVNFQPDNVLYPTGTYSWSIDGVVDATANDATMSENNIAVATTASTDYAVEVEANRMDYVRVTVNMNGLTQSYTVTGHTNQSLDTYVPSYDDSGAELQAAITVDTLDSNGDPAGSPANSKTVNEGDDVAVIVNLNNGNGISAQYRNHGLALTLSTGDVLYFPNNGAASAEQTVIVENVQANETITITGIEVMDAPYIRDVELTTDTNRNGNIDNGDKITVYFSEPVTRLAAPTAGGGISNIAEGAYASDGRSVEITVNSIGTGDGTITFAHSTFQSADGMRNIEYVIHWDYSTGDLSVGTR